MGFSYREINADLPRGWRFVKVSELADVNSETINKNYQKDTIRYIDISSVSTGVFESPKHLSLKEAPSRAKRVLREGDIIISTVRPNLRQYALLEGVEDNWIASTGFSVVRAKEEKTKWYLYSFLTSNAFNDYLVRVADGAAYPTFNPKEIEDAEIPLPDDDSLEVISNIARLINQKIDINNSLSYNLESLAQAIFKSWFVDFDPVHAKKNALEAGLTKAQEERAAIAVMAGLCTPSEYAKNTKAIEKKLEERLASIGKKKTDELKTIASLFPSDFEDSELGKIPLGWNATNFENELDILRGFSYKGAGLSDAGTPMHNLNSVYEGGGYKHIGLKHYTLDFQEKFKIKSGDIIVANTEQGHKHQLIGYGARIPTYFKEGIFSHHLYRVRPKPESHLTQEYLERIFRNKTYVEIVQGYTNGTTVNMLSADGIKKPHILVPSKEIILVFSNIMKPLCEKSDAIYVENGRLSELRDTLLPKLLSGEIDLNGVSVD